MNVTDKTLLLLYEKWSEEFYAAGFIEPSPRNVTDFREWMRRLFLNNDELEESRSDFLIEYHKQERALI